jgi:hypothetical protein
MFVPKYQNIDVLDRIDARKSAKNGSALAHAPRAAGLLSLVIYGRTRGADLTFNSC